MQFIFSLIALTAHSQSDRKHSPGTPVRIPLTKLIDSARKAGLAVHFQSIDSNTVVEVFPNDSLHLTIADVPVRLGLPAENDDNNTNIGSAPNSSTDEIYSYIITVSDTAQHRLAKASIKIVHDKTYMTNDNGIVRISSKERQISIEVSYTGMRTEKQILSTPGPISIALQLDNTPLTPAIVTTRGYFSATKPTVTGDRPALPIRPLGSGPTNTVQTTLDGQIAGLYNTPENGIPGSNWITTIRGENSLINNSGPTYYFNNMPLCTGNISLSNISNSGGSLSPIPLLPLHPNDTVEVLKDGDATAIYGSRGANGVIVYRPARLLLLKRPQIDILCGWGFVSASRLPKMLKMSQFDGIRHEAFTNDSITPDPNSAPDLLVFDSTHTVNWQRLLLGGMGHTQNLQVSLSGGDSTTRWNLGLGHTSETNVFPQHPANDILNLRGTLEYTHSGWAITNSAIYTRNWNHQFRADPTKFQTMVPDAPAPRDPQGNLVWQYKGINVDNALAPTLQPYLAITDLLLDDTYITYTPHPSLIVKLDLGYNQVTTHEHSLQPAYTQNPAGSPVDIFSSGSARYTGNILEPQVEYQGQKNDFDLNLLGGLSYQQQTAANQVAPDSIQSIRSTYEALFGRATVNYYGLYTLDLTGRTDGTSRLGPHETFGTFGAIGAAWLFSKENFCSGLSKVLDFGKLRFSYGTAGNDQIGDHQLASPASVGANVGPFQNVPGYYSPTQIASGHLHWEVIRKMEVSLDGGLWQDHLVFTVSWYRNTSHNQLLPDSTTPTNEIVFKNYNAELMNRGWEFTVGWKNIDNRNFQWSTSANFSLPKTKLLSFDNLAQLSLYKNKFIIGQSPNVIYGYQSKGVDPASGIFQFQHAPNESNPSGAADKKIFGTYGVSAFYGITNTITCGALEILVLVDGRVAKGLDYQTTYYQQNPPGSLKTFYANETVDILNHWQNKNDHALYQKLTTNYKYSNGPGKAMTYYIGSNGPVRNTSLVRLRKTSISYRLPRSCLQKWHVGQMEIFFNAENLLIITPYRGVDPLIQNINVFPTMRSMETGVHVLL